MAMSNLGTTAHAQCESEHNKNAQHAEWKLKILAARGEADPRREARNAKLGRKGTK